MKGTGIRTRKTRLGRIKLGVAFGLLSLLAPSTWTRAQSAPPSFTGHYVPGVEGVKGASLPPPGFYVRDYNVFYTAGQLNDASGNKVPLNVDAFVYANLIRGIWITDWKVLGGNYGMDMIVPIQYTKLSIKDGRLDDLRRLQVRGCRSLF